MILTAAVGGGAGGSRTPGKQARVASWYLPRPMADGPDDWEEQGVIVDVLNAMAWYKDHERKSEQRCTVPPVTENLTQAPESLDSKAGKGRKI